MNHPLLVSLWAAAGLAVGAGMKWHFSRPHPTTPKMESSAPASSPLDPATTWVENLPPGASRDRASVELAFLHGLTGNNTTGVALAATVQDPDRRVEAAGFALQQLWRRDPEAARSAATTLGLSPEHQERLATRLAKGEFVR